jgi:serine/threonine-protein kinase RsbT
LKLTQGFSASRREPAKKQLLLALEKQVMVSAQLRQQIMSLPDVISPGTRGVENVTDTVVKTVWLFAKTHALDVLRGLDSATNNVFAFYPLDAVFRIENEAGVTRARQHALSMSGRLGFRTVRQTKVATATSELARNIQMYAGRGEIKLHTIAQKAGLVIEASDRGPGIADVNAILSGSIQSKTGLGLGLRGVKSIANHFTIDSALGAGTRVSAVFYQD